MRINPRSLRVRLCLWYLTLTVGWMVVFGTMSTLYLRHTLESARQTTLRRRTDRLVRFLGGWQGSHLVERMSAEEMRQALRQFSIVAPESDLLEVTDAATGETYAAPPEQERFSWPKAACVEPCYRLVERDQHPMRLLQQTVAVDGQRLRVSMAGQMDEHDHTLGLIWQTYLLFTPFVLLGSVLGGVLLGRRALEPVDRMTRAASTISIQDLSQRLPVSQTGDEVQRLAEAWNDLLQRLEIAVGQLKQLTGDLSHDLRTGMTVMLASIEVALRRERTAAEYQDTLRTVMVECETTAQLLNDLLAASRSEQAQESIVHSPVPLSEVVGEVCEQMRGRVEAKRQQLNATLEDDVWVLGDASLLRRLTLILLDNAVKYTPEAEKIEVLLRRDPDVAELRVMDSGPGIAPGDLRRIFDRFYRADTSRNREYGGSGLGLSIAKWIAQAHGSEINVSSRLEEGSVFSIRLPGAGRADEARVDKHEKVAAESWGNNSGTFFG